MILRFNYVIFSGFKGFIKPKIKYIKMEFDQALQMFISSNGTGKSTSIREMSLFPIHKPLYKKGGYKEINFTHDGTTYTFKSSSSGNSLINEDGTDHIAGETISEALHVIKTLFGLTPYMWDIATGNAKFVEASSKERRAWIELISGINFDFPFKLYGEVVQRTNHTKRMVKELQADVANESSKVINQAKIDELVDTKKSLTVYVKALLSVQGIVPGELELNQLEEKLTRGRRNFVEAVKRYTALNNYINHNSQVNSMADLNEVINQYKSSLAVLDSEFKSTTEVFEYNTELKEALRDTETVDIVKCEAASHALVEALESNQAKLTEVSHSYRTMSLSQLEKLIAKLSNVVNGLPAYAIHTLDLSDTGLMLPMSSTEHHTLQQKLDKVTDKYREYGAELSNTRSMISFIKEQSDVTCTKCDTKFKPNDDTLEELELKVEKYEHEMNRLGVLGKELRSRVNSYNAAIDARRAVLAYVGKEVDSNVELYVESRFSDDMKFNNVIAIINNLLEELYIITDITKDKEEFHKLTLVIDKYNQMMKIGRGVDVGTMVSEAEAKLVKIQASRRRLLGELSSSTKEVAEVNAHVSALEYLAVCMEEYIKVREEYVVKSDAWIKQHILDDVNIELAKVTRDVQQVDINRSLVENLTRLVNKSKSELTVLVSLEKALSPKSGIIGKQITGYTNHFARQLTEVINSMWGYKLEVLPCEVGNGKGMTYKFGMRIENDPDVIPDISDGSTAQQSVINLAVLLTTRHSLGLNGIPIVLDEAGTGLDTVHSQSLGEYLHRLFTKLDKTNILLVHHDPLIRGMLGPHNTVVYDKANVLVSEDYNEHVEIVKYA